METASKHNEPRRHKIPKAKYKVSNWRDYDRALQQRGSLTVWVTPEALEAWAPARPGSAADVLLGHRHRDRGHAAPGDGAAVAPD